jgi:hypothetical protein
MQCFYCKNAAKNKSRLTPVPTVFRQVPFADIMKFGEKAAIFGQIRLPSALIP